MEKGILRGELQRNDCRGGGGWMSITSPPQKKGVCVCCPPHTHLQREGGGRGVHEGLAVVGVHVEQEVVWGGGCSGGTGGTVRPPSPSPYLGSR